MNISLRLKIISLIRDCLIIIAITVLMFLLVEGFLRVFYPQNYQTTYLGEHPPAVVDNELRYVYHPDVRWVVEKPEFKVEYFTNNEGMRDKSQHIMPKPQGLTRILLLGDSFTFGAGNNYEKIWTVILEKKFFENGYKIDVVKAGISGFDTYTEVVYLERIYHKYQPDIVLFAFQPNDLLVKINSSFKKDAFLTLDKGVISKSNIQLSKRIHTITLFRSLIKSNDAMLANYNMSRGWKKIFIDGEFRENQIDSTKKLFLRAKEFSNKNGSDFMVLSIPEFSQVLFKNNVYNHYNVDADYIDTKFSKFAEENNFTWIETLSSLAKKYKSDKKDLYFRLDGHLNNEGNEFVGNLLYEKIIEVLN